MAHFAELDDQNVVTNVVVVNNVILYDNGVEKEAKGEAFLRDLYGPLTKWKQCSYNGNIRGRYPAIGAEYIPENDIFSEPRPYASWVLNRSTGLWEAPVAEPVYDSSTHFIFWDEASLQWVVRENPPEHNRETHFASWDEEAGEWVVLEIPSEA